MKCKKILNNNQQCQAFAQKDKEFCFRHDPTSNEAKLVASSKGGRNRALQGFYGKTVRLETPEDVKRFLGKVINGVWAEGVPVPVGSSMGFLTRCWLDAYEASDIVKRLDEIENKLSNSTF
ncbi:hypothetical protein HY383_03060 [Candidatus Daviesbacteria bacterium]|nr:hypothetical protein [Candidatus Daviesbacteria bacterium]